VYESILYTPYTSYMLQPSSGMCITKYRYIKILQKFLSQCAEVKLNFKNNAWFTVRIEVKTQIKSSCEWWWFTTYYPWHIRI